MAPPARPLPVHLIPDILVRLAPDDPAAFVRSSAVCKAWRRILADPAFAARYRALHPTAPVLGFVHNQSARLPQRPRPLLRLQLPPPPVHHRVRRLGPDQRRRPAQVRSGFGGDLDAAGRALRRRSELRPSRLRRGALHRRGRRHGVWRRR